MNHFGHVPLLAIAIATTDLMAAPGGYIVREAFHSPWLRIVGLLLALILSPILIYQYLQTRKAKNLCREGLQKLAKVHDAFHVIHIQQRVKECFQRVHAAWDVADVSQASRWMTNWYWQNQQLLTLNRWKKAGLKNVCRLQGELHIEPIYFSIKDLRQDWEGSFLVVKISGEIEDYLIHEQSQKIVDGQKGFISYSTIWTFKLHKGQWLLSNIAPSTQLSDYLKLTIELPELNRAKV